jgi:ferredoxin
MKITKVWLDESKAVCISCGLCATIEPRVFQVHQKMIILKDIDFELYRDEIICAVENCPFFVIAYEETN